MARIDLTGQRFGRLVAIKDAGYAKFHSRVWECWCDCGNTTFVNVKALKSGHTKSCGCALSQLARKNACDLRKWVHDNDLKEHTKLSSLSQSISSNNTSGVKGVHWNSARKMWVAQLEFQRVKVLHSEFTKKEDAIKARREAEEKYFKPILEKYHRDKE